jgi:hypothetical protein
LSQWLQRGLILQASHLRLVVVNKLNSFNRGVHRAWLSSGQGNLSATATRR